MFITVLGSSVRVITADRKCWRSLLFVSCVEEKWTLCGVRRINETSMCGRVVAKEGQDSQEVALQTTFILVWVNHPNILQLIDTFETKKEFYIIQELATGGDVFDWILEQGYYSEKDASNVIRQVLEAVSYLHSLRIVHRNLKLENLMYYNQNNHSKVVLRDFYLSCFESGEITEPCGTPEYLAPEVVSRHRYGRPVDCWAVGVVMYILLSGNPPFYDENEEENSESHNRKIFRKILVGEYEFDSPYWDVISASAKDLVSRLMEMDQEQRITAQEALGHIWISGNAASETNLKDGVCAQIEKNFAKAKWRKAIRVTTFMQRLRAPESSTECLPVTPRSSMSVSHEVTVEACPPSPAPSPSPCSLQGALRSPRRLMETAVSEGHVAGCKEHGGP
uniref:Protein kinase domain-containing protein n=1 Tax=Leptobrachium leishanense TaxID=445787 RepID=A0A8C5MU98_9ANUR